MIVLGCLALFFIFLSLVYILLETYILRERFYGDIPYSVQMKFLRKRVPIPLAVVFICLVIVWIVFVH